MEDPKTESSNKTEVPPLETFSPELEKARSKFIDELSAGHFSKCRELLSTIGTVNYGNSFTDSKNPSESYYYNSGTYDVLDLSYCRKNLLLSKFVVHKQSEKSYERNPLITMAWNGKLEAIEFLVENTDVDIEYLSENNTTAIMYAFQNGKTDEVVYLLSKGAKTEIRTTTKTIKMTDFASSDKLTCYGDLINYFIANMKK